MAIAAGKLVPYATPNKLELRGVQVALDNIRESLRALDGRLSTVTSLAGQTALTNSQGVNRAAALQAALVELRADVDALEAAEAAEAMGAKVSQGQMLAFIDDADDGEDGMPGLRGLPGLRGPQSPVIAIDGEDGEDGFGIPGLRGLPGIPGIPGTGGGGLMRLVEDGDDGEDGFGFPGRAGTNGTNGTNGTAGLVGFSVAIDGEDGDDSGPLPDTSKLSRFGGSVMGNLDILGDVAAASFTGPLTGHASLDLALTGGVMSGLMQSTSAEVARGRHASPYFSGYDAANTTRTGYLQFISGSQVLLKAEQTNSAVVATTGGGLSIATGGDAAFTDRLGIGKTTGSLTDVLDCVSTTRAYLSLVGGGVGTTSGVKMTATAGPSAFSIDIGIGSSNNFRIFDNINAVERLRIDNAGKVGIGVTPSGNFNLEIVDVGPTIANLRATTATSYSSVRLYNDQNSNVRALQLYYTGSTYSTGEAGWLVTTGAYPLVLGTNNLERMRIDSAGNVGIGMTPSGLFDVDGTVRAMGASSATTGSATELEFTGGVGYLSAYNRSGSAWLPLTVRGSTVAIQIAGTAALSIDALQHVGIGAAAAAWGSGYGAIDVHSTASTTGASFAGSNYSAYITANAYHNGTNWIRKALSYGPMALTMFDGAYTFNSAAAGAAGSTIAFTERLRIDASGNVGIGVAGQTIVGMLNVRQDTGDGPLFVIENRVVNAAVHKYGALIFSPYRDVANPVYGAAVWAEGASAAGYTADLVFGTSTNSAASTFPTARMRINADGNVGIGPTPQAWNTTYRALEIGAPGGGALWGSASDFYISSNSYYSTGAAWTRILTAATSSYRQSAGAHQWFTDASGSAGTTFTQTQRMRIDVNGLLTVIGAATVGTTLTVTGGFGCNTKTAQTAVASGGAVDATAPSNVTPYGFTTSAQAAAIITAINNIRTALVANGIMS